MSMLRRYLRGLVMMILPCIITAVRNNNRVVTRQFKSSQHVRFADYFMQKQDRVLYRGRRLYKAEKWINDTLKGGGT
jgi:hypothetical protein